MTASRSISIRLSVQDADQFKQAFAQAGAAGQASMQTLTNAVNSSAGALKSHTQAAGLAQYQIVELTESAHKFADIILSGGSAIRGLEFELPKFIGIAGGVTQALGAIGKALPLLGIAAAVGGIYELGKAANDQQSRMALLGQQVRATRDDYESYSATLEKTARQLAQHTTLSTADARTAVNTIGTNPNFSGNSADITRLSKDAQDLSVIFKTDLAGGTKIITDGLNNAAKAAKELEEKGIAGFTPGLVRSIELLQQSGKFADAFSLYLKTLEARSSGAADAGLTPLGAALKRLDESFNGSKDGAKSWSEAIGGFFDAAAARGITNLSRLIEKLNEARSGGAESLGLGDGSANDVTPWFMGGATTGPTPSPKTDNGTSPAAYNAMRDRIAKEYGVDPDVVRRLNATEGHRNADGSWADGVPTKYGTAVGGFQVLPSTFALEQQKYGFPGNNTNDEANARAGILYYREQLQNRGGDATKAYYDYHDGPGADHTSQAAIAAGARGFGDYSGTSLTGYSSDGMINAGRKSDEQTEAATAGTRAINGEKLQHVLDGIEKQLQAFEVNGRQKDPDYAGLVQREQETQAAIRRNALDPQHQALQSGQDQLNQQRLARRYGFTPAGDQLAATQAQAQVIARDTGSPVTNDVTSQRTAQFYEKAGMELTRLQTTQAAATAGNERLAAAYAKGGTAVADLTAKNEALQQINLIMPPTAATYAAAVDKQTESNRKLAQSLADVKAQETAASDTRSTAGLTEQNRLAMSGESDNQQAQDYAAFQARQANQTASPSDQDGVARAAQQRVAAEQALSSTRANYNELQSFGSNTFDRLGSSMTSAFTSGANAAKSFSDIAKSVLTDVAQEFEKLAVLNPIKNAIFGGNSPTLSSAGGLLGSLLGMGGTAAATASASAITSQAGTTGVGVLAGLGGLYHSGGIVGYEPTSMRMVDPSVFYGAPRMHTGGIAGGEVPAVLQAGEGVFTQGQMAAIGAGMGGGGPQQAGDTHFNFNVNAQGAGPREIDQLRTQIPLLAMQAVQSGMQRGGQFAKTVRGS